ncbi:lamin tail domain-containing protein [Actinoplanes solisilvae]|uniref:lamin tail domain-containing protein n=1 Tax=Actinoplanes solisilvae TaxID=2486853 RepID=UPI000FDAF5C1|nr:lamin tail domain-containing protein [Actinoplanes solisilvae]
MRRLSAVLGVVAIVLGGLIAPGSAGAEVLPVVRFHSVQYDSPGADNRSPDSLNQEWISVVNTGVQPVNLRRWTVRDDAGKTFTFGGLTLRGNGARVVLHTGKGRPSTTDVFWNSGNYVWNNTGDAAELRDASGRTVDSCSWTSKKGRSLVAC